MAENKNKDFNGAISLWERESRNGVFLSGVVEIDGVKYNITLNPNISENPKAPAWRGKMKKAE